MARAGDHQLRSHQNTRPTCQSQRPALTCDTPNLNHFGTASRSLPPRACTSRHKHNIEVRKQARIRHDRRKVPLLRKLPNDPTGQASIVRALGAGAEAQVKQTRELNKKIARESRKGAKKRGNNVHTRREASWSSPTRLPARGADQCTSSFEHLLLRKSHRKEKQCCLVCELVYSRRETLRERCHGPQAGLKRRSRRSAWWEPSRQPALGSAYCEGWPSFRRCSGPRRAVGSPRATCGLRGRGLRCRRR